MSKKLLVNNVNIDVPNLCEYYQTYTAYPIEVSDDRLCEEHNSFLTEIYGNTWQDSDSKNLFDKEAFYDDWTSKNPSYLYKENVDGEEVFRINDGPYFWEKTLAYVIPVVAGKYYTLSAQSMFIPENDIASFGLLNIKSGNNSAGLSVTTIEWTKTSTTILAEEDKIYICSGYYNNQYYYIKDIQLEEGSIVTEYEPYHKADLSDIRSVSEEIKITVTNNSTGLEKQEIPIVLPQPLRKVGNYADRLYWDEEKGKYCIEQWTNIPDNYNEVLDVNLILPTPIIVETNIAKKINFDTYSPVVRIVTDEVDVAPSNLSVELAMKEESE